MTDTTYSVNEIRKQLCGVQNCTSPRAAKGLCWSHYFRLRRYGNPEAGGVFRGEIHKWVEKALGEETDACILWPFAQNKGYGVLRLEGRAVQAHRHILTVRKGEPPTPGHEAAHICGEGLCCNYRHLRWDTHAGNMADMLAHGTSTRGEKNRHAKLTAADVLEIRARLAAGETGRSLARDFGVGEVAISSIRNGKNWGWLQ